MTQDSGGQVLLVNWLVAIGTIALAVIAAFQDKIRSWLMRPRLNLSIIVASPDCHKTTLVYSPRIKSAELMSFTESSMFYGASSVTISGLNSQKLNSASPFFAVSFHKVDCYYFRVRVKNSGNLRAELVEMYAKELLRQQADGEFKKMDSFLPMNLIWSHIRTPFLSAISPKMEKYCDLGHIIKPTQRSKIECEDNPNLDVPSDKTVLSFDVEVKSFTMGHLIPPGTYRLVLQIAAANTKPVEKVLQIVIKGDWYEEEAKMFSEGVGIKVIQ